MHSSPVLGLDAVVDFDALLNHSIALTRDGKVFTWGDGGNGRLGLGINKKSAGTIARSSFRPLEVSLP